MRMIVIGISIFSFTFLSSCNDKKKDADGVILPPAKMQLVLWDMLQAQAFTQAYIKIDSNKNAMTENASMQKKIFELHKINRQDFNASYNYYSARPDEMEKMLDSISAKGERNRSKIMQNRYGGGKPVIQ